MGELAQASKARSTANRSRSLPLFSPTIAPTSSEGTPPIARGPAPTEPLGPTISHHLKVLTDAGLIERDKGVVWAYNRAVPATLQMIADLIAPPVD